MNDTNRFCLSYWKFRNLVCSIWTNFQFFIQFRSLNFKKIAFFLLSSLCLCLLSLPLCLSIARWPERPGAGRGGREREQRLTCAGGGGRGRGGREEAAGGRRGGRRRGRAPRAGGWSRPAGRSRCRRDAGRVLPRARRQGGGDHGGGRRRGGRRRGGRARRAACQRRVRLLARVLSSFEILGEGEEGQALNTWARALVPIIANNRDECHISPGCWQ